jgi:hypothetical protein
MISATRTAGCGAGLDVLLSARPGRPTACHLTPAQRAERGAQAGCIAGVPSFADYRAGLAAAGFAGISITPAHQVADGLHSAIIRAARP